ncbi:MAG: amino acid racemase [Elusimicrobiota bacterium]|nr:amino acid racemase [Elusimicrobiota bacterium]
MKNSTGRMPKTIGIIGGMGPEATLDLFAKIIKLTPAKKDQDHIHIIIDNYPQIPDRTNFILFGDKNPKEYILSSAKLLENAGAGVLIMACNTAHFFERDLRNEIKIPFISIVDAAINELKELNPCAKNIAVLSTTGTKAAKIYDKALIENGYNVLDIPNDLEKKIMSAIYDGVKKGKACDFADSFQKIINEISDALKPDAFIEACTEIPILMNSIVSKITAVDANYALARAAVKFAEGRD